MFDRTVKTGITSAGHIGTIEVGSFTEVDTVPTLHHQIADKRLFLREPDRQSLDGTEWDIQLDGFTLCLRGQTPGPIDSPLDKSAILDRVSARDVSALLTNRRFGGGLPRSTKLVATLYPIKSIGVVEVDIAERSSSGTPSASATSSA